MLLLTWNKSGLFALLQEETFFNPQSRHSDLLVLMWDLCGGGGSCTGDVGYNSVKSLSAGRCRPEPSAVAQSHHLSSFPQSLSLSLFNHTSSLPEFDLGCRGCVTLYLCRRLRNAALFNFYSASVTTSGLSPTQPALQDAGVLDWWGSGLMNHAHSHRQTPLNAIFVPSAICQNRLRGLETNRLEHDWCFYFIRCAQ